MRTGAIAVFAGALLFATPRHAFAQEDRVLAEALFREGRDLMDAGKVTEACGKFGESYRLDRAIGTLINLALCHEKDGKTASAWAEFNEAAADAAAERDDREAFARKHIATLTPELARLRIVISSEASSLPTLDIRLDGHTLGRAAWSSPLPIDPGDHELAASAEGKKPISVKITIAKGPGVTNANVPALEEAPRVDVQPLPVDPPRANGKTQRTIGYIVGGVGVAGLAVGGVFGLFAIGQKNDRDKQCGADGFCDQNGVHKDKNARTDATVSTIGFIAGGVLVAGGVVLVLTAPKARPAPRIGFNGRDVFLGGTF